MFDNHFETGSKSEPKKPSLLMDMVSYQRMIQLLPPLISLALLRPMPAMAATSVVGQTFSSPWLWASVGTLFIGSTIVVRKLIKK